MSYLIVDCVYVCVCLFFKLEFDIVVNPASFFRFFVSMLETSSCFLLSFLFFVPFFVTYSLSPLKADSRPVRPVTSLKPLLSSHLQVLKPLSENYMEDNVRQTVVNSIKASLTEQVSQHAKLKTHWSSSSSSFPPAFCSSAFCPLAQCFRS